MANHGKLFDQFTRQSSHPHGGSYFDSGFSQQAHVNTHGRLHDLFGVPKDSSAHGQRFDEFGWKDMPAIHGQLFDTDFRQPTAHTAGEHGTWFDVFRGGAQVRYMLEGADYEGTVIDCNPEYATVRSQDGQTHEVGLSQFVSYRTPNEQQASPATPRSDAQAPSAHDATAAGNATSTKPTETFSGELPSTTEHVTPGPGNTDRRSSLPDGLLDTFTRLKSHAVELDVVKDVDATETATQAQDLEGASKTVGHRNSCPRGGSAPCGAETDGKCSLCDAEVHDHDAVGKASTGDLDIDVPEREHKSTDHHTDGRKPGVCPHCGGALDELDEKTEQGQPDRAHKCLGSALDVVKSLVPA